MKGEMTEKCVEVGTELVHPSQKGFQIPHFLPALVCRCDFGAGAFLRTFLVWFDSAEGQETISKS